MDINYVKKDEINGSIVINIPKSSYEKEFRNALVKHQGEMQIKGFRKGKTPINFIKKMYGKGVLSEVINKKLQNGLNEYIAEEKMELLGQPIPAEDQKDASFNVSVLEDFSFKFDIGLSPEFELKGISEEDKMNLQEVKISKKTIKEELELGRKKVGELESVEGKIEDEDLVKFQGKELKDGEPVAEGHETNFSVLVSKMSDSFKKTVKKSKKGTIIDQDIFEIEKDATEDFVKKYILQLEENNNQEISPTFRLTIEDIQRRVPAELNQEFFDKYFGPGNVSSEKEAKDWIENQISKQYQNQAESLLFRDFQDHLMNINNIDLPDEFLKRWLKFSNEKVDDETLNSEYNAFNENLKWSLIKSKIVNKFEIAVHPEDLRSAFSNKVRSYFYQYGYAQADNAMIDQTVDRMMENKEEVNKVYEELIADKVFEKIRDSVTVNKVSITEDKFKKMVEEAYKKIEEERKVAQPEE